MAPRVPLFLAILSSLLCLGGVVHAQGPFAVVADPAQLQELVQQLRSESRSERILAERSLTEFGEQSVPFLEKLAEEDAALALVARRIIGEIGKSLAQRNLEGQKITLASSAPVPLSELLEEVARQSGMAFLVDPRFRQQSVTYAVDQQPFWQVVDDISRLADLGWEREAEAISFLAKHPLKTGQVAYPPPLRVAALPRQPQQNLELRTPPGFLRMTLRIDAEPQIIPYFLVVRDAHFELTGTLNESELKFIPFNPEAAREVPVRDQSRFEFTVDFVSTRNAVPQTLDLQGEFELFCAPLSRLFQLNRPEPEAATVLTTPVRVVTVGQTETVLTWEIEVDFPEGIERFESHRQGLLHRDVSYLDAQGDRHLPQRVEITRNAGRRQRVEIDFELGRTGDDQPGKQPSPSTDDSTQSPMLLYRYPEMLTFHVVPFSISGIRHPLADRR